MNCLLLIDIQNDFLPGGNLAVPAGDQVISVANQLMPKFPLVVATQDWHPAKHKSFASNHPGTNIGELIQLNGVDQILWPDHCIQNSMGAKFAEELDQTNIHEIIKKGTDVEVDSYSGFFDNQRLRKTSLDDFLKSHSVERLSILGLATDYCVKFTALDAIDLGYKTELVVDGCRGVNLTDGDVARALEEMKNAGVQLIESAGVGR